jgi:hypothetical protein
MLPLDIAIALHDQIEAAGPRAVVKALAKVIGHDLRAPRASEIMAALSDLADQLPTGPEPASDGPLPF